MHWLGESNKRQSCLDTWGDKRINLIENGFTHDIQNDKVNVFMWWCYWRWRNYQRDWCVCGWRCIITVVVLYDDELARNVFPWYNIEVINIFTHFQTYNLSILNILCACTPVHTTLIILFLFISWSSFGCRFWWVIQEGWYWTREVWYEEWEDWNIYELDQLVSDEHHLYHIGNVWRVKKG